MRIPVDSTPYAVEYLPFANEIELQGFVEGHAEKIFGLTVVSSTRRGGRRLFGIDILAVDCANTPFILECKWDLVDAGAVRQLEAYSGVLQHGWDVFQQRVSELKRRQVRMTQRAPILVAIGYRYDPSVLADTRSVVCLTHAYHDVTLSARLIEERGPGKVSIQAAHESVMPSSHPRVSKKRAVFERLAPLPQDLQEAFWAVERMLCGLGGVTVVYGGKNFVRYRISRGRLAEATIGAESIKWRFAQPGLWRQRSEIDSVEMLTAADTERVLRQLRRTYQDAG